MFIDKIAQENLTEPMEAWDETLQAFVPGSFLGRIDLADRFLSNFNKPLRRRMLYTRPGTQFPQSFTFRHPGSGDIYLIGQGRQDAAAGNPYIQLNVCHLVTDVPGGSSGLATLYRRAPSGPPENPGWLVEHEVKKAFMDIEFRTSAKEADTYEIVVENYYAFLPRHIRCEEWDFLELQGKRYRVVDVFADSGMSGLRVDEEVDPRINFVLHKPGTRTYNRTTHEYEVTSTSFNVTGVPVKYHEFPTWSSESVSYIDVFIDREHIGFRPEAGQFLEFEGRKREIKQVSTQPGERQYRLRCE